jgi:hypothetical protein
MSITAFMERIGGLFGKKPRTGTRLRDGDSLLISVKSGVIIAQTFDIALSHAEFVKRTLGTLPEGAWVGTLRKTGREVWALNSKTFYGNQLPAPQDVQDSVRAAFY